MSGPKRSMAHMSTLSLEVKTMSFTSVRQPDDLGIREGGLQHLHAEVMVRVEVRHVDVREVLAQKDDLGGHLVAVAETLRRVDEDGVLLAVDQRRVAVEAQVAVQEDLVLERQRRPPI